MTAPRIPSPWKRALFAFIRRHLGAESPRMREKRKLFESIQQKKLLS
jgi:hypothetical protein